jgi:hypothetical protein
MAWRAIHLSNRAMGFYPLLRFAGLFSSKTRLSPSHLPIRRERTECGCLDRFFQSEFFPISLYYLGMVTFKDRFSLSFPNLSVKKIFTEYFNELEDISVSEGYTDMFRRFVGDGDWVALFAGYWNRYVGQIPAQAFDQPSPGGYGLASKANENFFRTTFYELCTRYLTPDFHFAIEVNCHGGRSDWQAVGRKGSPFEGKACVIEFKHFTRKEGERLGILELAAPQPEDAAQVGRYTDDLRRAHPELAVNSYVAYTVGSAGGRLLKRFKGQTYNHPGSALTAAIA